VPDGFRYARQVQFAETDMAGIVHFSWMFKYMEEAEHALWRAAGMHIARFGEETSWPRLSASFDFKNPLYFEDEFEVVLQIDSVSRRTIRYACTIVRGDTTIGTGVMTTVHVRKGPPLKAIEIPEEIIDKLQEVGRRR
jgi:YbgC/YbaW family acyl-CoA thioester hydrolase